MSFKTNDVEQLSLFDSFLNLTAREQKALENSWAKVFAVDVMIMNKLTELIYTKLPSKTIIKKSPKQDSKMSLSMNFLFAVFQSSPLSNRENVAGLLRKTTSAIQPCC